MTISRLSYSVDLAEDKVKLVKSSLHLVLMPRSLLCQVYAKSGDLVPLSSCPDGWEYETQLSYDVFETMDV